MRGSKQNTTVISVFLLLNKLFESKYKSGPFKPLPCVRSYPHTNLLHLTAVVRWSPPWARFQAGLAIKPGPFPVLPVTVRAFQNLSWTLCPFTLKG